MEAYQIIILVALLLLFVYVGAFLLILSNSLAFSRRLRKRAQAMLVLIYEKQEVLLSWFELLEKEKAPFSEEDLRLFSSVKGMNLAKPSVEEWTACLSSFKEAQMRLGFLSEEAGLDDSHEEKSSYVSALHDLDFNYRQSSAVYNADVVAYNYWISIPGFSWLLFLFGFRKKTALN